jgi:arylsulfatase A-like enzyme
MNKKHCSLLGVIPLAFISCNQQTAENQQNDSDFHYDNVVVIISDDHAPHTLGSYGNDVIRTPNLDRLSAQGVQYNNMYCNAPICSASRQSMLTGKYPTATGVTLLFTPFNPENNTTIGDHLQDQGFKTALFGKTHFNDWIWYPAWEEWPKYGFDTLVGGSQYNQWVKTMNPEPLPDNVEYYQRPQKDESFSHYWNTEYLPHKTRDEYSKGTFLANSAIDYIEKNKDDRFFVWLAFHQPHAPFFFPEEYRDSYDPAQLELPETSPEDDRWVPELFANYTDQEKKNIIASYYTSVEYMDKNIGLVMDALEENDLDENTLVVYVSDNGYLLYDHKRFEKHTMWKESVQVPLIWSGKNIPTSVQKDDIIEGVDLVPTIVDMLGLPPMEDVQGTSFKESVTGERSDLKPFAYSLFLEDNLAMVANKEWKYVFMTGKRDLGLEYATGFGAPGLSHFLYDIKNDPRETTNLAHNQEHESKMKEMQQEMLKWFKETHPDAANMPETLTMEGKLMWFCEPRDVGAEHGGTPLRIIPDQIN